MRTKISILFPIKNTISINFTLYPFWISKMRKEFDFFHDVKKMLLNDKNNYLIIIGKLLMVLKEEEKKALILLVRKKYEKLILLDDLDGSESQFLEFLPYLDLYYKKQIYKDKSNYLKTFYGGKIYTDYYNKKFGINVENPPTGNKLTKEIHEKELEKFRVFWNLGIGQYYSIPKINNSKLFAVLFSNFGANVVSLTKKKIRLKSQCPRPEKNLCQARFQYSESRSIVDFQRKLFLEIIGKNDNFLVGKLPHKIYKNELKKAKAVLSPFGFGEICFRDFEAIFNGSVIIKPDMSHLETWPNIFIPNFSYIPISWDGSDLLEKVELVLNNNMELEFLSQNSWNILKVAYESIDDKVLDLIQEITNNNLWDQKT